MILQLLNSIHRFKKCVINGTMKNEVQELEPDKSYKTFFLILKRKKILQNFLLLLNLY